MHLTINEIVYFLKTWNGWYLFQHDGDLNSQYSENKTIITISPFNCKDIPEEVMEDLKDYTDDIVDCEPDTFKVGFRFHAWEHQPDEIFESLKPILEMAINSHLTIENSMDFIETDLPEEGEDASPAAKLAEDLVTQHRPDTKTPDGETPATVKEVQTPEGEKTEAVPASQELTTSADEIKSSGPLQKLHNQLVIQGTINKEYIDVAEITHNNEPFPEVPIFLEAARLFETLEINFQEQEEQTTVGDKTKNLTFTSASPTEAATVTVYLGTSSPHRPQYEDSIIHTDAPPEDLATVITFIRYEKQFKLFKNPYYKRIQQKRREHSQAMKAMMKQSCSCLGLGFLILLGLVIWWASSRGGQ